MISKSGKLLVTMILSAVSLAAAAQNYPDRPIRLILGVAAGGGQDTVARAMAPRLSSALGVNVIIDNRPGGGGNIGVELAKQASPDGYTLLMISASTAHRPFLYTSPLQSAARFHAGGSVSQPYLLVVTPRWRSNGRRTYFIRQVESGKTQLRLCRQRQPDPPGGGVVQRAGENRRCSCALQRYGRRVPRSDRRSHSVCVRHHCLRAIACESRPASCAGGFQQQANRIGAGSAYDRGIRIARIRRQPVVRCSRAGRHAGRDRKHAEQGLRRRDT
ncbi:MAG: hypothetical protein KIT18_07065 [Burkholderiales bacterium]|nr:hypothetical protein [Burkholderiales bacterium]